MRDDFAERLATMPDAKKIAIAIYGESVAAYRYGVLADKAASEEHRKLFAAMRDEEKGHRAALEHLGRKHFPDCDFVLTSDDKDLVIAGARMLEVGDAESFHRAMRFLHDTELRTSEFYRTLHESMHQGEIGEFLEAMAEECVQHAESLLQIDPP